MTNRATVGPKAKPICERDLRFITGDTPYVFARATSGGATIMAMSHPLRNFDRMELEHNHFACVWCGHHFQRRSYTGRKPHYCSATCRQRAYEARRRGYLEPSRPAPPPLQPIERPAYQAAVARGFQMSHAVRPAGFTDKRRRLLTLCGTWARPLPHAFRSHNAIGRPCLTCSSIATAHPPLRPFNPVFDLAALRALAARLKPPLRRGDPAALGLAARELLQYAG